MLYAGLFEETAQILLSFLFVLKCAAPLTFNELCRQMSIESQLASWPCNSLGFQVRGQS